MGNRGKHHKVKCNHFKGGNGCGVGTWAPNGPDKLSSSYFDKRKGGTTRRVSRRVTSGANQPQQSGK